jgi:FixJ family two-component response regulator
MLLSSQESDTLPIRTESQPMGNAAPSRLVAIVADDLSVREALRGRLESAGYVVEAFGSAEEFLKSARRSAIGCLVLDVRSPGVNGLAVQTQLLAEKSTVPVIFITGTAGDAAGRRTLRKGVAGFLEEPVDPDTLLRAVRSASKSQYTDSKQ